MAWRWTVFKRTISIAVYDVFDAMSRMTRMLSRVSSLVLMMFYFGAAEYRLLELLVPLASLRKLTQ